jgi:hypothetical protein
VPRQLAPATEREKADSFSFFRDFAPEFFKQDVVFFFFSLRLIFSSRKNVFSSSTAFGFFFFLSTTIARSEWHAPFFGGLPMNSRKETNELTEQKRFRSNFCHFYFGRTQWLVHVYILKTL